jgi:hypothetical protein
LRFIGAINESDGKSHHASITARQIGDALSIRRKRMRPRFMRWVTHLFLVRAVQVADDNRELTVSRRAVKDAAWIDPLRRNAMHQWAVHARAHIKELNAGPHGGTIRILEVHIQQFRAVRRPLWHVIAVTSLRQPLHVRAVGVHDPHAGRIVPHESDAFAVGRNGRTAAAAGLNVCEILWLRVRLGGDVDAPELPADLGVLPRDEVATVGRPCDRPIVACLKQRALHAGVNIDRANDPLAHKCDLVRCKADGAEQGDDVQSHC